jgi:hypothetical protein
MLPAGARSLDSIQSVAHEAFTLASPSIQAVLRASSFCKRYALKSALRRALIQSRHKHATQWLTGAVYYGFWYFRTNSSIGVGARKTMTSRRIFGIPLTSESFF